MNITYNDFENADIGRLAIYLAHAWTPRPAQAVPVVTSNAGFAAFDGYGVLLGVSFADTSGAANTISLHDGASTAAPLIGQHTVAASTAELIPIPVPGIRLERGLTVVSTAAGQAVLYLVRHARHD